MESILGKLTAEAPSALAVIIIVIYFLRALEKRDVLYFAQMDKLTERISAMESALVVHDTRMDEAIKSMHRTTNTKRRRKTDKVN